MDITSQCAEQYANSSSSTEFCIFVIHMFLRVGLLNEHVQVTKWFSKPLNQRLYSLNTMFILILQFVDDLARHAQKPYPKVPAYFTLWYLGCTSQARILTITGCFDMACSFKRYFLPLCFSVTKMCDILKHKQPWCCSIRVSHSCK